MNVLGLFDGISCGQVALRNLADGYTDGISKAQRYKCIGNGWTVGVIEHILKNMEE